MHSTAIGDELKNNQFFRDLLRRLEQTDSIGRVLKSKGTVLQLVHVERLDNPKHHMLFANTHLFYGPESDFSRTIQSMVCMKYIESVKAQIMTRNPSIEHLDLIFAGDMNSDENSNTYAYLANQPFNTEILSDGNDLIFTTSQRFVVCNAGFVFIK